MWISCEGEEFILFSFNRKFRTFELRSNLLTLGKIQINLFFRSLIRNIELRSNLLTLGKEKKNKLFFCFSLAYS